MPFIQIQRPTNGHVLAEFSPWHNYNYRFPDGNEVPLDVQYAWCHRCEEFVEAERLYTREEIQEWIDALDSKRGDWEKRDAEQLARYEILGEPLSDFRTLSQRYEGWKSALIWCENRKSSPRCLKCGSFTAIVVLHWHETVPHPYGVGVIMLTNDGMLGGLPYTPPPVYYDAEGVRLDDLVESGAGPLSMRHVESAGSREKSTGEIMAKITRKQIAKSVAFTVIGAAPGTIWFFNAGTTQSIVIGCLGALVGLGLSLPGVSAARVAGGTVGMIAANNAPRRMQGQILDTFLGENESPEDESNPGSDDEADTSKK